MAEKIDSVIEQLSPLERKVIPFLNSSFDEIQVRSNLDHTSILRALRFLENKKILVLSVEKKRFVDLGTNGVYYKKHHLPERNLILVLEQHSPLTLEEAKKLSKLSDNEFKVSLGVLKGKALVDIKNGKMILSAAKEDLMKRSFEELLIEDLPLELSLLSDELRFALANLSKRKEIVEMRDESIISFSLTAVGKQLAGKKVTGELLEEVTPEMIQSWKKNKKLRQYDILSPTPRLFGGKSHFVNQAISFAKQVWLDLGFVEMKGSMIQTSFWNFDVLFTAQDHPVRDLHDTFYLKNVSGSLPKKSLLSKVKKAHESGIAGSVGWQYEFSDEESRKVVLRTHTTCLSALTLASLNKDSLPQKFFALGKCFRNETVDWSHGFEFNQTEGIVIDRNVNFRHLLGYLQEFFAKMGFRKIRFTPAYFPYTEPSVEISAWHPDKKVWLELGGAGMFRPEVIVPLMGEFIPVLAWGPGFDRIIMDYYKIKDLREMYENDMLKLRSTKIWVR